MKDQKGPSTRNIPAHSEKVCNGCIFLDQQAMMRGHKTNTDNYSCTHPKIKEADKKFPSIFNQKGRSIHFNHSGPCTTPSWCPFLQPKQ